MTTSEMFGSFRDEKDWLFDELPLTTGWAREDDREFAHEFLQRINDPKSASPQSCETCIRLSRQLKPTISLSELSKSSESCELCGMLFRSCKDSGIPDEGEVNVSRDGSTLWMNPGGQLVLRLCAGSGLDMAPRDIPTGFPILPEVRSPARFELFREWLRTCDEKHQCSPGSRRLPTRVLEVQDHNGAALLRLRPGQGDTEKYIALSHRWNNNNFCTYPCNITARQKRIDFERLPKRFQDAITVTRELGIRFLWIDSICIIQKHAPDGCPDKCRQSEDWDAERDKMEEYFGSAYCTIAATSAAADASRKADEGFLERRSSVTWVKVPNTSSPRRVSDGDDIDNFHRDVEDAELNRRGWVLQERALSRRTIHFTSTQTYWECGGGGVRCETLTEMRNPTAQFLSDSQFPKSILNYYEGNRISLFERLFQQYSTSGLTVPTDRSVAISGLEKRLRETFNTKGRYGIFERYQHRCLLWRSYDERMEQIPDLGHPKVPSWSWMAYAGGITYMNIRFERVEWSEDIKCHVEASEDDAVTELKAPARKFLFGENDEQLGRLIFDGQDRRDIRGLRCIVIGKETDRLDDEREYYVLVVTPLEGSYGKYERVGVGSLKERDISPKSELIQVI